MSTLNLPKISTSLWFDTQAEEAANLYVSVLPDSRINAVTHFGDENPDRKGQVLTVDFELNGHPIMALNGGPVFQLSEAVSIVVNCEDQDEIDRLWSELSEGGQEGPCGWLKDRFGLSWQITPKILMEYLVNGEVQGRQRAVEAMYKMGKLDIAALTAAYEGR